VDELDLFAAGIALGFGVPDLFNLEQPTVTTSDVVLAELERRAPTRPLEGPTVGLLDDGTVPALSEQPLPGCRNGSGDHVHDLERTTLWNVSPDWV
jgi:hypothetical protein